MDSGCNEIGYGEGITQEEDWGYSHRLRGGLMREEDWGVFDGFISTELI